MANKNLITFILIAIVLIAVAVGIFFYYNNSVTRQNAKISSLNAQAVLQQKEITNLTNQIQRYCNEVANLTINITITQASGNTNPLALNLIAHGSYVSNYSSFFIIGSVTNTGNMTAYNAGLQVMAYSASGSLEINMTVPLVSASEDPTNVYSVVAFGVDNQTQQFASMLNAENSLGQAFTEAAWPKTLGGATTVPVDINIIHETPVVKWTVTPVWTDTP